MSVKETTTEETRYPEHEKLRAVHDQTEPKGREEVKNSVVYVAGFLFDSSGFRVALIEKQRPKWQRGKFNGIGGHVEEGEAPYDAMRREFHEETGIDVREWYHFATLAGESDVLWTVHFFCAHDTVDLLLVRDEPQKTDEHVTIFKVHELDFGQTIPNLRWLIPMAQSMRHESAARFMVREVAREGAEVY